MNWFRWTGFAATLSCLLIVAVAAPVQAADIAWITFHPADDTPSNNALTAGFTVAPDKGYTDLLSSAGHSVTRILTKDEPNAMDLATLNGFDLVIVGRSVNSSQFQSATEAQFWDTSVTAPVILMSGYLMRNSRLGFTTGATIPDTAGTVKLAVADPAHPIFSGISLDGGNVMVNDYAGLVQEPFGTNEFQRGISVNTDPLAGSGTLLASISTAGDPADGGTIIAEWMAGDTMSTATADVLGGHRLVFLSGSRERNTIHGDTAGGFDLTPDGAQMLLNAVDYMAVAGLLGDFNGDQSVDGRDFLTWQRDPGIGELDDWKNNYGATPVTANTTAVPEPATTLLVFTGLTSLCLQRRRDSRSSV